MDYFIGELDKLGYQYHVDSIRETFRFGGGERLVAEQQYVIPHKHVWDQRFAEDLCDS